MHLKTTCSKLYLYLLFIYLLDIKGCETRFNTEKVSTLKLNELLKYTHDSFTKEDDIITVIMMDSLPVFINKLFNYYFISFEDKNYLIMNI